VDEEDLGVMMEWEAPLMQAHAQLLCGEGDRDVLNVGFGMVRSQGRKCIWDVCGVG
jgi:protein arginine N-methyltransferase 2